MTTSSFWPKYVQITPDPLFPDVERHILVCSVGRIPPDVPSEAPWRSVWRGPRSERLRPAWTDRPLRRITLTASSVRRLDAGEVQLEFRSGDGIVDGRALYRMLVDDPDPGSGPGAVEPAVEFEVLSGHARPIARELASCLARPLAAPCFGPALGLGGAR